jgi:ATP-binding cassette, subfamily B, bacterial PglK
MKSIFSLWNFLSGRRRKQFYFLLALMFASSFAEIISLGLTIPFLGVLTSPEEVYKHDLIQPVIQIFNINSPERLILLLTMAFIFAAIFAGLVRLLLLYVMSKLAFYTGADIGIDIYRRTLYQDYSVHISRNSSEVFNGILTKSDHVIAGVVTPFLTIVSSLIIVAGVVATLFYIDIVIAASTAAGFGFFYWITIKYTHKRLQENGQSIAIKGVSLVKSLQEGLGGIRDVLINGSQEYYCDIFRSSDMDMRRASSTNQFISGSPRFIMEALGITLIAIVAYILSQQEGGLIPVIPVLGALAIGAQRLLPLMQQAYHGLSTIKGSLASLDDVLLLLNQPLPENLDNECKSIDFAKYISLENLSFSYAKDKEWIFKDVNLKIEKGSCVGFVGTTGSGKSTLLDVIMFLLKPTSGSIKVDNVAINESNVRAWQKHIAHVPQSIYLSDSSIAENIAFGMPREDIDFKKVEKSAKMARISKYIEDLDEGYDTHVGERGVQLSGGQQQRIGIARALYQDADVLILDESTSALDDKTEKEVMETIQNLSGKITILIIAHRLTTLSSCSTIVKVGGQGLLSVKSQE